MVPQAPAPEPPESSTHDADDHPEISARNARLGLWLFAAYLALYAGFMFLSAFAPDLMQTTPLMGVNLAVLYGLGLIGAALVLALVYVYLCRPAAGSRENGGGHS